MTNISMSLKSDPFLLRPAGKDYLWGGNRLNDDFSKNINMQPAGGDVGMFDSSGRSEHRGERKI